MNRLIIPIGGCNLVIAASGSGAQNSLAGFAKLIGEHCINGDCAQWDLLLTDKCIPNKEGRCCLPGYEDLPFIWNLPNGIILQHHSSLPPWISGEWQQLVLLSALKKMIASADLFIMHGALLEVALGKGIILYGHSGVGKSTTMVRCRMAGFSSRGDDVILCTIKDKKLYASPLPTPSYCREYYTMDLCYNLRPELEIEQLLYLRRSDDQERIVEISRDEWLAPIVHSLSFHYLPHLKILPHATAECIGNIVLDLAMHLAAMFPYKALEAHYSGNIAKTLMAI